MKKVRMVVNKKVATIYINEIVHFKFNREGLIGLDSWAEGTKRKQYYICYNFVGGEITCDYDDRMLWESILKTIDEQDIIN